MSGKIKAILSQILNILFSSLAVLSQEIFMSVLPVFLLVFLCILARQPYPLLALYNNFFIGCTTLNAGNIIYIHSECENNSKKLKSLLLGFSIIDMLASLAGSAFISLSNDMGLISINLDENYFNDILFKVSVSLLVVICFVEFLKIANKTRE